LYKPKFRFAHAVPGVFLLVCRGQSQYNRGLSFKRQKNMANTAGARKAARQSSKRRILNASQRTALRSALKKVVKAIKVGDKAVATLAFREASSVVDRIADKKIIHKNKAARSKSRLSAKVKAMA